MHNNQTKTKIGGRYEKHSKGNQAVINPSFARH